MLTLYELKAALPPHVCVKDDTFVNMRTKCFFVDATYGEWRAYPYDVFLGKRHSNSKEKSGLENQWSSKNGILTYSNTEITRKVWWKCHMSHDWVSSIKDRIKWGRSCPYCPGGLREDLTGKRFGKLLVLKTIYGSGRAKLEVRCDCGVEKTIGKKTVLTRNTKSCGCAKYKGLTLGTKKAAEQAKAKSLKCLIGHQFGQLLVLSLISRNLDKRNRSHWLVKCSCGVEKVLRQDALKSAKSCGCLRKVSKGVLPHGEAAKNDFYRKTKLSALRRGLVFNLSMTQVLGMISLPCAYCEVEPQMRETKNKSSSFLRNGIDRRDNTIGYEIGNCVPCCNICNRAKSNMNFNDWLDYLNRFHLLTLRSKKKLETPPNLDHKHLLITAYVNNPPIEEHLLNTWLVETVEDIGMKVVCGPTSKFVDTPGNEGLTGSVNIETSHLAIHVWSNLKPALIKLDVYSCKCFEPETIVNKLKEFDLVSFDATLVDRNGNVPKILSTFGSPTK